MSLPPAALLPFLARHPTERFVAAALTADVHSFPPTTLGGTGPQAPIWLAATADRLWLCAWDEVRETAWAVAAGRPDQVHHSAGWQRDEITVAGYRAKLRRGSRKEVADLVQRWTKGRPDADPWPLQLPCHPESIPPAKGAPSGTFSGSVPSISTDERWLATVETDLTWPAHPPSGPTRVPVVVGCTDRRTLAMPLMPHGAPGPVFELPLGAMPTDGRGWVLAGTTVRPKASKDQIELVDAMVAITDPAERWSLAARHALITGSVKRSLRLMNEAATFGLAGRCWPHLVQLCLALDQGPLAAAAAWRALADDPDLDVGAIVRLGKREAPAVARIMNQANLKWSAVRRIAPAAFDALVGMPPTTDLWPWPPTTVHGCWATAAALNQQWQLASRLYAKTPLGPDRDAALAVCASHVNRPAAAERWRAAAQSARSADRDPYQLLSLATEIDEQGRDRWLWGYWCWKDRRIGEARAQWRRGLALHADGAFTHPLEPPALVDLATVAVGAGYVDVATAALRRAIDQAPADLTLRRTLSAVLAGPGANPAAAADVLVEAADAIDSQVIDEAAEPRWRLWVDAAILRRDAGRPDAAQVCLREALAGDFLALDAWRAVLDSGVELPDSLRGWWAHIYGLLSGQATQSESPLPPRPGLDDASLDLLHPGGAGWLANLRHQLDPAEAPSYVALTRGLDRLRESDFDEAAETVEHLSTTLELDTPPASHVFRGQGAWGISAWPSTPPVLLVGATHLRAGPRHLDAPTLRFAIAAELVHLRCNHPVLTFDASWLGTSRSVYDQVNGWAGTAETVFDLVTLVPGLDQAKKVQTVVKLASTAFRTRGALDKAVKLADPVTQWLGYGQTEDQRGLSREGLSGTALQFRVQAERAALVLTSDLGAAVRATLALSTKSANLMDRVNADGLQAVLADPDSGLAGDELFRLTALVEFAATRMPWGGSPTRAG